MAVPGLSSLGVKFGYAVEATAGTKPSAFNLLTRINSIGGITITPETIDASALEDTIQKTIAGRGSTGGTWTVTVNYTADTQAEWAEVIEDYNEGMLAGKQTWFEVFIPTLSDAFYVVAQPPQHIPMPAVGQNELLTVEINLTIVDYKGEDTAIEPT